MDKLDIEDVTFNGDIASLFAAFAKAQTAMKPAVKSTANSHFNSSYADITAVLGAILPALNANGLSLLQMPGMSDGKSIPLVTVLAHSAGGRIQFRSSLPFGRGSGPQAAGSAITYLRRYCAQAVCGLPAVDDDGNGAQAGYNNPEPEPEPAPEYHPTWPERYKDFIANAEAFVDVPMGSTLMDELKKEAKRLKYTVTPAMMDEAQADAFLQELAGGLF
jgi:hypothetical protein